MNRILFLFFTFSSFICVIRSQELITDFKTVGTNSRDFVHSVDSINYLIQILPDDEINIYEVINSNSVNKLSTRIIQGSFQQYKIRFHNKYIYFYFDNIATVYDLVNDNPIRIEAPLGYQFEIFGFRLISDEYATLHIRNNPNSSKYMYYNFVNKTSEFLNDNEYIERHHNNISFIGHYEALTDTRSYFLYDIITKSRDTLLHNINNSFLIG